MRFRVFNIEYDGAENIGNMPTEVLVNLSPQQIAQRSGRWAGNVDTGILELCMGAVSDQTGWCINSCEVEHYADAEELHDLLKHYIDRGRLEIDPRAVPNLARAAALAGETGILPQLYATLNRLIATKTDDIIHLYADGDVSFGILWYKGTATHEGSEFFRRDPAIRAFMAGGLIYRGPETNPAYTTREWSVHT